MNVNKKKVLLIEDSDYHAVVVQELLGKVKNILFEIKRCSNLAQGLECLDIEDFDVVLLDLVLPDCKGLRTFARTKRHAPGIPIVILTSTEDDELTITALRGGAQDYLIKGDFTSVLLVHSINYAIERKQAEVALRKAHDTLEMRVAERTAELTALNERLKQEIIERKRVEKRIKKSLAEKQVLLGEIHHRVKNNMQVISSLLRLQGRTIKNEKYLELLRDSQNRIELMALVHEKLYRSEDMTHIDSKEYIKDLITGVFLSHGAGIGKITTNINIKGISLELKLAMPIGLIINELVSNSLKYAFPENKKGKISVSLHTNKNEIELIICDNGIGFPQEIDFKNIKTLGLQLVTTLVEKQLDGKIELDRSSGAKWTIKCKKG